MWSRGSVSRSQHQAWCASATGLKVRVSCAGGLGAGMLHTRIQGSEDCNYLSVSSGIACVPALPPMSLFPCTSASASDPVDPAILCLSVPLSSFVLLSLLSCGAAFVCPSAVLLMRSRRLLPRRACGGGSRTERSRCASHRTQT